ncbi:MAG: YHS domain-containing (seleno)protein [Kofleriaceae bacterium]
MCRLLLCLVVVACGGSSAEPATVVSSQPTAAPARVLVNVDAQGIGLGGNDPIAYATDGAVAGVNEFESSYGGARYRFATQAHKAAFDADAWKRAPAYGGYCAYAASQNRLSPSDPEVFLILDGTLLVFTNREYLTLFEQDRAGNKLKADKNWLTLVTKFGT